MPTTFVMKSALTISGSDSSGGAGIQADIKTVSVLGVYGMSAVTAVAAENTLGIKQSLSIDPDLVRQQIDAVAGDLEVNACKTGMLANAGIVDAVADAVRRNKLQPYVCDPALVSKSGGELLEPTAIPILKRELFPLA